MRILFYERMGYIEYYDTKELQEKASQMDASVTVEANDTNKAIYENTSNKSVMVGLWANLLKVANFTLLVKSPIFERVFKFYANLIDIDHTNKNSRP